jgi:hypothetical protein
MFGFLKAYFQKRRAKRFQQLRAAAAVYLKTVYTPPPVETAPAPSQPPPEDMPLCKRESVLYDTFELEPLIACESTPASAPLRKRESVSDDTLELNEPKPLTREEERGKRYSLSCNVTPSDTLQKHNEDVRYSISINVDFNHLKASASEHLVTTKREKTFLEELNFYIRTKGLTAPVVYQRANMDKRHYSKLISGILNPTRDVAIALAIALRLNDAQAQAFIGKAGYTLSTNCERDVLVRFCLQQGLYNINEINLLLDSFHQKGF